MLVKLMSLFMVRCLGGGCGDGGGGGGGVWSFFVR